MEEHHWRDGHTLGIGNGTEREDGVGSRNAGTDTRDAHVSEWPRGVDGDAGSETGDSQVGGWTCVVAMTEIRVVGRKG